ncbi:sterol desaturase family protein [Mesorhizobium sp.]|uniref:sterol desaturase family protein n=1 Tax=Mesorhizobium sp. TaxID=1871066 RepID=UPI000FD50649|nr:sterol desaturase family protein [Mesorhizobium sp.]RVC64317.1 sterol desaturase family protein [Mesorhizobium sp. M4B.F.Ca.ET.088.02.2.1]RWA60501.1 MAG: sterol desaturase family protein [Mesorhizobium sp.]RWF31944.1 MAG: sterol desaturase family protein [Mesorhizobium sp.]RWF43251.1 MAG: sterol desaturase family protein [Mesorhizobium sp.]TIX18554.1 MAG: sterol desaturase family protein [Mesorhizobium sp.]
MDVLDFKALLITALIFVPIERLFALHPAQKILRKAFFNDLIYAVFNGVPIAIGIIAAVALSTSTVGRLVPDYIGSTVSSQPVWLQVIEIILIADIGFYLAHRAFHAVPFLWRFHAVHHSIEELDWLAAHRIHPIDQILTKSTSLVPVYLLGFSSPAIGLFALIFHAHALLQHANIKLNIGPLRWLIASPQFHHWHHANEREAYDKNFAGQLSFIDALFGTIYLPGKAVPERYGVDDAIPPTYVEQLAYPLMPKGQSNEAPATRDA